MHKIVPCSWMIIKQWCKMVYNDTFIDLYTNLLLTLLLIAWQSSYMNLCYSGMSGFTKLHMCLVVLVKKCQSSLIFCCKISILCQSLAKSAQILLVMSDRTDKFRELWYVRTAFFAALRKLSPGLNSKPALSCFWFAHIKQQIVLLFRSDLYGSLYFF
jgi:hypothetical protein